MRSGWIRQWTQTQRSAGVGALDAMESQCLAHAQSAKSIGQVNHDEAAAASPNRECVPDGRSSVLDVDHEDAGSLTFPATEGRGVSAGHRRPPPMAGSKDLRPDFCLGRERHG